MNVCPQKPECPGSLKDPVVFSRIHNICPGFQPAAEDMLWKNRCHISYYIRVLKQSSCKNTKVKKPPLLPINYFHTQSH
jgi:hypothetical protein